MVDKGTAPSLIVYNLNGIEGLIHNFFFLCFLRVGGTGQEGGLPPGKKRRPSDDFAWRGRGREGGRRESRSLSPVSRVLIFSFFFSSSLVSFFFFTLR